MSENSSSSSGIGVVGLLGVVFITLKLCGVIDWSWWWVTAPFWGGLVLVAGFLLVTFVLWLFNRRKPKVKELAPLHESRWLKRLERLQEEQKQARAQQ